jgi:NAD+ synthase (glutamine-hydrolysing)
MGFSKAILGSSGGIDSAVVLALAVEALGKDNVISLMMPSAYSSEHSVADAKQLSENLGNENHLVPILDIHNAFTSTLDFQFRNTQPGLAEENIQSRIRGNLLMAMANKRGAVLLNTSNKSELATGYGTLYGDMAGGISVLGDCYKLQVYELAKHINRNEKIIPVNILTKAPSAELRPDQKDTDSLPEYDVLDPILFHYIEKQISPSEIKNHIDAPEWINNIIRMVNANEYKRHQFCPILRISPKSLGSGRKMPIVAKFPS